MREKRIFSSQELRATREDQGVRVSGYAAVYDKWSVDLGGFRERISHGAFGPAIERSDVRLLANHEGLPLARRRGIDTDTLKLEDRKEGLWIETFLASEDPDVQRLIPKMERGDLDQMSFAFSLPDDGSGEVWEGRDRTLTEFGELFDVSLVTNPAYVDTTVALRSLQRIQDEEWEDGPITLESLRLAHELRLRLARG